MKPDLINIMILLRSVPVSELNMLRQYFTLKLLFVGISRNRVQLSLSRMKHDFEGKILRC